MTVQVGETQTFLMDRGAGAPTLLLHGSPDSSHMWRPLIEALPSGRRYIAPDLPGYGLSTAPEDFDYSLESQTKWVDGLVAALEIETPVNLVVHDFGGPFGLAWAATYPEKVRRIVIFNTNFFSDYHWHSWAQMMRAPIVGEAMMAINSEKVFTQTIAKTAPRLPAEHIAETFRLYTPAVRRHILRLYRATDPKNFRGWENKLRAAIARTPTMVLWGDQDPFIEPRYAEKFGAERVEHFQEYSHWLPVEAPQEIARRLDEFFQEA
ncbi:alpha/beta fold hydrolase [Capsulimonas corticalis]|nr:alpha/beta hydrolase [Capsulimonas corticalis]